MKISVLIPAYNAAKTIDATIRSVLAQTVLPYEILVLNDGSTDETLECLKSYEAKITVVSQTNSGVAVARNVLCQRATGEILAFLDADDQWHPQYLEFQRLALLESPSSVASFVNHINVKGLGAREWPEKFSPKSVSPKIIQSAEFIRQYNQDPSLFGSPSFCCIRKSAFAQIGPSPFPTELRLAEDYYVMNLLPFYGTILFIPAILVAYRETSGSLTSNRLTAVMYAVDAFALLRPHYENAKNPAFRQIYYAAFASKRREYAKYLMGTNRVAEARKNLELSWKTNHSFISVAKSSALWFFTFMPIFLQPNWPSQHRT